MRADTSAHLRSQHEPPTIALVDENAAPAWDRFVEHAPEAAFYHRYAWRRVVHEVFGRETYYFAARDGRGEVSGVLPLVRLRSMMFGDFLVSLPYFNYGGVLADCEKTRTALLDAASELAQRLCVTHLELRHRSVEPRGWPSRTDKVAMLLPLPDSSETLWKSLSSKLRAQIKRPLREGASCVFGSGELLDEFYAVFAENMRDLGTPVYSRRFFESIVSTFPETTSLAIVRLHSRPVAAALMLRHRDTLEVPWASSLRSANSLGVNVHLYWNMLARAAENGIATFDFGRCTTDSGAFRFKRQWGAQPEQLHWHYWLRSGRTIPKLNPSNSKYRVAIAAWQRLPLPLANWIGPKLVKNLP